MLWGLCKCKHAFLDSVSKVDGSISGKSLRKTGSRNSMKGTMMKTMKGTRRNRSAQVLSSCEDTGTSRVMNKQISGWIIIIHPRHNNPELLCYRIRDTLCLEWRWKQMILSQLLILTLFNTHTKHNLEFLGTYSSLSTVLQYFVLFMVLYLLSFWGLWLQSYPIQWPEINPDWFTVYAIDFGVSWSLWEITIPSVFGRLRGGKFRPTIVPPLDHQL